MDILFGETKSLDGAKAVYYQMKADGHFDPDEYVCVGGGRVVHSSKESEVLLRLHELAEAGVTGVYFTQVGREDRVYDIPDIK